MIQATFPIHVEFVRDHWEARCDKLHLLVSHKDRDRAEGRLLVQVYHVMADKIASHLGDLPEIVGTAFLMAAVVVARKALDGSSEEKQYARDLIDSIGQGQDLKSPLDILQYDPESRMPAKDRLPLVLAAMSEVDKETLN